MARRRPQIWSKIEARHSLDKGPGLPKRMKIRAFVSSKSGLAKVRWMVGAPEPGKTDESLATLPLGTTRCLLKEGDADRSWCWGGPESNKQQLIIVSNETISNKTTEETEGVVGMRIDLHFPAAQIRVLRGQNWVHHLISFYGKESLYHKEYLLKFPFLRVQKFRSYGESLESQAV